MQDVAKIGRKHDIVTVSDGYGMNKLLPKGLAKPATPENIKAIERQKEHRSNVNEASHTAFAALTAALKGAVVEVQASANDEGKLFQAVKPADIAVAIATVAGHAISADQVVVETPIKSLGEHMVTIAFGADTASQPIVVTAA